MLENVKPDILVLENNKIENILKNPHSF